MDQIWTEENKYGCWLRVEAAASAVLAEDGMIPAEAARAIETRATFSVARIQEIEAEVKHDVIAFTTAVAESLNAQGFGDQSRWLHYGLTSNDVVDTAQALQVNEASTLIREGLMALLGVLKRRAIEFKHTPTIGRQGAAINGSKFALGLFIGALAGSLIYNAIFVMVSAATTRAIAVGLLYVLIWEALLSNFVSGARLLSVSHYGLGIANGIANDPGLNAGLGVVTSVVMGAIVTVAALALAVNLLSSFTLKGDPA